MVGAHPNPGRPALGHALPVGALLITLIIAVRLYLVFKRKKWL